MKLSNLCIVLLLVVFNSIAFAKNKDITVKFTKEEVKLLKKVKSMEKAFGFSESIIIWAPLIEIFSTKGNPIELTATIKANSWELLPSALKNLKIIKSCGIANLLASEIIIDEGWTEDSEEFFTKLYETYYERCTQ